MKDSLQTFLKLSLNVPEWMHSSCRSEDERITVRPSTVKKDLPANGVICYLAANGSEPCLQKIVRRTNGSDVAAATLGVQGKKTIKTACIGLLVAKARSVDELLKASWHKLADSAGFETWPASFVQTFHRSNAWWTKGVAADLKLDEKDFPLRVLGDFAGPTFTIHYNVESSFWKIFDLHFVKGGDLVDDRDGLLGVAADLEDSEKDWTTKLVPRPQRLRFTEADVKRLELVQPDSRSLFNKCRDCAHENSASATASTTRPRTRKKVEPQPTSNPFIDLFAGQEHRAQRFAAHAHYEVAQWLRKNGTWNHARPTSAALQKLHEIACQLQLPLPLLYDLSDELHATGDATGKLPALHHGCRAFPLRPASDTVALQVPLLEPERIKAGEPLKLRAFRGWLVLEKVPVPRNDQDQPLWPGGHVYPAPVFALLDQDLAWREAIRNAVHYLNSEFADRRAATTNQGRAPLSPARRATHGKTKTVVGPERRRGEDTAALPASGGSLPPDQIGVLRLTCFAANDHDFRWSLARTDGGVLPPMLLGNHLGAALALLLRRLIAPTQALRLDPTAAAVLAGMREDGTLEPISVPPRLAGEMIQALTNADGFRCSRLLLSGGQLAVWRDSGASAFKNIPVNSRLHEIPELGLVISAHDQIAKIVAPDAADPLPELPRFCQPRPQLWEEVFSRIAANNSAIIEIIGGMGRGKTTFMAWLLHRLRVERPLEFASFHFTSLRETDTTETIAASFLRQLQTKYPGIRPDGHTNAPRLQQALQQVGDILRQAPAVAGVARRELFVLDAADQLAGAGPILPGVFQQNLPDGVFLILTTRQERRVWKAPGVRTEEIWFDHFVDDLRDIETYLRTANQRCHLRLSEPVFRQLFQSENKLAFKTVPGAAGRRAPLL